MPGSKEKFGAEGERDDRAQADDDQRRDLAEAKIDGVRRVHPEMAQPGAEMKQVGPDQRKREQLPEPARQARRAEAEDAGELLVRGLRAEAGVEHPDDERQQQ